VIAERTPDAAPAIGGKLTLQMVQANWQAMRDRLGERNKNLPPLLAMSRPLAVEGDVLILGFDYPIFREKFDKIQGAAHAVADAFFELTGARCRVRCVVTGDYAVPIAREEFESLAQELGGVVHEE
jgi:DNA polymerase-3 subunit gamma/tau